MPLDRSQSVNSVLFGSCPLPQIARDLIAREMNFEDVTKCVMCERCHTMR